MNLRTRGPFAGRGAIRAILLTAGVLTCSAAMARAEQAPQSASGEGLAGTWMVRVTLRDCATDASLGSFDSLVTFNRGGTLAESTSSPAFAIGQRSSGHGDWDRDGNQAFTQRLVSLINFSSPANLPGTPGFNPALPITPGFFAGWATVIHAVRLVDRDHGTSSGTNAFYKTDGTLYRTGCSTSVLARFD